jgi:hypothetical protein
MAGYEPERTLYRLDFSQTKHKGLKVTTAAVTLGELMEFVEMADDAEDAIDIKAVRVLLERFGGVLEDWNVTRKEEPVPPTYEGLLTQEFPFVQFIINAWITEMSQAPPPLQDGSSSGETSPEVPAGLAAASRNLQS